MNFFKKLLYLLLVTFALLEIKSMEKESNSEIAELIVEVKESDASIKDSILESETKEAQEKVIDIDESDVCSICRDIPKDNVELSCGHKGCKKCLKSWIDNCKALHLKLTCTLCRAALNAEDLEMLGFNGCSEKVIEFCKKHTNTISCAAGTLFSIPICALLIYYNVLPKF